MSLYYEAAQVLDTARSDGGSIKSIVFGKKEWQRDRKALFALSTETAKWSEVLSEVLEKSGVLKTEKQLTPTLALLLAHDLLVSKKGLALPKSHGLFIALSRHKARLTAELTKVRLRRGCATWNDLWRQIQGLDGSTRDVDNAGIPSKPSHPRWIRINTLETSLDEQLTTTFADYSRVEVLCDVSRAPPELKVLHVDQHVPNLVAVPSHIDFTHNNAYKEGKLILQDKASCFPAYLLDPGSLDGDVIDACAAPGNKTTHLTALLSTTDHINGPKRPRRRIFACERDSARSETLAKMVDLAGAGSTVLVRSRRDFLKLDTHAKEFANVSSLLLDPSCSGSGIIGRDEVRLKIHLPNDSKAEYVPHRGKKRRRNKSDGREPSETEVPAGAEEIPTTLVAEKLQARLSALSAFQLRLLEHAMTFPAAERITYSTCSVHNEENEHVVVKALASTISTERGWRIMRRDEQVDGLRKWDKRGNLRGVVAAVDDMKDAGRLLDVNVLSESCIRCEKGGEDGTMGFFVAGFVRDVGSIETNGHAVVNDTREVLPTTSNGTEEMEDEWNGFSDNET